MSDFKPKMHQIRFRLGLCPRTCYRSLQPSPNPLTGFKEPNSKGDEGRDGKRDEGEREGRGGLGKGEGKSASPITNSWIGHWAGRPDNTMPPLPTSIV